jgi:hypothetical protein
MASRFRMRRPLRQRTLTWLVALTLLVQAVAFGWMRPAAAAEQSDAPQIEGWVICTAHSDAAPASEPAGDAKHAARHDLTCTLCVAGCIPPMALLATTVDLPLPSQSGRIERIATASLQPRAPPFTLPNARAPPSLS